MLTLEQQGMLVCHMLNVLPQGDDLPEGVAESGCCPSCCAPCRLLCDLDRDGLLTTVVKQAPEYLWGDGVLWWKDGGVDRRWLHMVWSYVPCPAHEDDRCTPSDTRP